VSSRGLLTAESAEILGAIIGDKGTFKRTRRYGFYKGYDLSKYHRYVMSICLGNDKGWGYHISDLMFRRFGLRGSTCYDGEEWRFFSSSTRVFKELSLYYNPEWGARSWRISDDVFKSSSNVKKSLIRGYFDADGYPRYSKARRRVLVQVNSVNRNGLLDMRRLLQSLRYHPGLYRRYRTRDVWELVTQRDAEIVRFFNEIGFSIERKQTKLKRMLKRPHG
jgi:hypothetical protein